MLREYKSNFLLCIKSTEGKWPQLNKLRFGWESHPKILITYTQWYLDHSMISKVRAFMLIAFQQDCLKSIYNSIWYEKVQINIFKIFYSQHNMAEYNIPNVKNNIRCATKFPLFFNENATLLWKNGYKWII